MSNPIPSECMRKIRQCVMEYEGTDALELLSMVMKEKSVRIHGPEHHFIVSAVIVGIYANSCNDMILKKKLLNYMAERAALIPSASCILYGTCGVMMGSGAALSVILSANMLNTTAFSVTNRMTARIQERLSGYEAVRCCKRATWIALDEAIKMLVELGLIASDNKTVKCPYSTVNTTCFGLECEFFALAP